MLGAQKKGLNAIAQALFSLDILVGGTRFELVTPAV